MATADEIIVVARKYIGVAETGVNNVKFNTAYYGKAVNGSAYPWCAVFVWYVFKEANAANLYYGGQKTAYCPTLMQYYKDKGQLYKTPKVGDIVFFNFSNGSVAQHVGIVTSVGSNTIKSIEGNTSSLNNTNGGEVRERTRYLTSCVGFARPAYSQPTAKEATTMYTATIDTVKSNLMVRVGAGTNYAVATAFPSGLPKGAKIGIDKESNGWAHLAGTTNPSLWVYAKWLKK